MAATKAELEYEKFYAPEDAKPNRADKDFEAAVKKSRRNRLAERKNRDDVCAGRGVAASRKQMQKAQFLPAASACAF